MKYYLITITICLSGGFINTILAMNDMCKKKKDYHKKIPNTYYLCALCSKEGNFLAPHNQFCGDTTYRGMYNSYRSFTTNSRTLHHSITITNPQQILSACCILKLNNQGELANKIFTIKKELLAGQTLRDIVAKLNKEIKKNNFVSRKLMLPRSQCNGPHANQFFDEDLNNNNAMVSQKSSSESLSPISTSNHYKKRFKRLRKKHSYDESNDNSPITYLDSIEDSSSEPITTCPQPYSKRSKKLNYRIDSNDESSGEILKIEDFYIIAFSSKQPLAIRTN